MAQAEWRVVERERVALADTVTIDVITLRLDDPDDAPDSGAPRVRDTDLEVRRGEALLYGFRGRHPGQHAHGFDLRDLDGDAFAEIVVWSSALEGEKERGCARVLRWDANGLRESAADELCADGGVRGSMRWVESAGGSVALFARPSSRNPQACTEFMGSECWFEYLAFGWDSGRHAFTLRRRLESRQRYDADFNPLEQDLPFIAVELGLGTVLGPLAQLQGPGAPPNPADADRACEGVKWILLHRLTADLGADLKRAQISLLRSCGTTGWTGTRPPHYDLDLVVSQGGHIRYRFWKPHKFATTAYVYRVSDELALRDVTGDGDPEILFQSGFFAASNFVEVQHILRASRGAGPVDVSVRDFMHLWEAPFAWVQHRGVTLAIKAQRTRPANPESTCHSCPYFAEFRVWRWDPASQGFTILKTMQSSRAYGDESALQAELDSILEQLPSP